MSRLNGAGSRWRGGNWRAFATGSREKAREAEEDVARRAEAISRNGS